MSRLVFWIIAGLIVALAIIGVRKVDAANAANRHAGGPLSACPNQGAFDTSYRWTNGRGTFRGCVTGYGLREGLTSETACGIPLRDEGVSTVAVSANVPALNIHGRPRCGEFVKACGRPGWCWAGQITDRGPYIIGSGGDYGRDMDLNVEFRRRIGVNVNGPGWDVPVIVFYKLCDVSCRARVYRTRR